MEATAKPAWINKSLCLALANLFREARPIGGDFYTQTEVDSVNDDIADQFEIWAGRGGEYLSNIIKPSHYPARVIDAVFENAEYLKNKLIRQSEYVE